MTTAATRHEHVWDRVDNDTFECLCGVRRRPRLFIIEEAAPVLHDAISNHIRFLWEERDAIIERGENTHEANRRIKMATAMLHQLTEIEEEFAW